jgi:alkylhydroperoxidase family enzyme
MSECRVGLLEPEAARKAAEGAGVPAAFAELNIFRLLLRRPATAKGLADLLVSLLFRGELDHRLRELVIMRIGWVTGSDYEWTQHWSIAQERFGVGREELLAVREWRSSQRFGPAERAVLEATDETLETGTLSAATWARCAEHLDANARIELVAAIGAWQLVSQLTRSLAIPLEAGVASWPPDGAKPPAAP